MNMKKILAITLAMAMALSMLAGCGGGNEQTQPNPGNETTAAPSGQENPTVDPVVLKQAEYNTTTSVMPSNWNELPMLTITTLRS